MQQLRQADEGRRLPPWTCANSSIKQAEGRGREMGTHSESGRGWRQYGRGCCDNFAISSSFCAELHNGWSYIHCISPSQLFRLFMSEGQKRSNTQITIYLKDFWKLHYKCTRDWFGHRHKFLALHNQVKVQNVKMLNVQNVLLWGGSANQFRLWWFKLLPIAYTT